MSLGVSVHFQSQKDSDASRIAQCIRARQETGFRGLLVRNGLKLERHSRPSTAASKSTLHTVNRSGRLREVGLGCAGASAVWVFAAHLVILKAERERLARLPAQDRQALLVEGGLAVVEIDREGVAATGRDVRCSPRPASLWRSTRLLLLSDIGV